MAGERRWGQPLWVWYALGVSVVVPVVLLLFSLTVSGRVFAVMLFIAEAFIAMRLFLGWARAEHMRSETELFGFGEQDPPV